MPAPRTLYLRGMELLAFALALYRKPLFILIGVVLVIAFVRHNPWIAALMFGVPVIAFAIWVAIEIQKSRETFNSNK